MMNGENCSFIISIIVPVYNVEQYLNRCIESLVNQTYSNIEIIIIDDGSTDHCAKMCDDWATADTRIKCIHKDNRGLSDARNKGLLEARGLYILFVDSDDYIEPTACELFVKAIGDYRPDIVVGNAKVIENNKISMLQHHFINHNEMVTGKQYLILELKSGTMYRAAWLNLYNRKFLLENELEFEVGRLHEDEQFTPRVFLKAQTILATNIMFYNYIIRENSITTRKNQIKNAEHIMQICEQLSGLYNQIEDEELKRLLNDSLVNIFLNAFQVAALHRKEHAALVNKKFLIGKAYTRKNRLRVGLFTLSPQLYYDINRLSKALDKYNIK